MCFSQDLTASVASKLLGQNYNTINAWYKEIRLMIFKAALSESGKELGGFELDES